MRAGWRPNVRLVSSLFEGARFAPAGGSEHFVGQLDLERSLHDDGWTVARDALPHATLGVCDAATRTISLAGDLEPDEQLRVLVHGAAHTEGRWRPGPRACARRVHRRGRHFLAGSLAPAA
jgi:hypothetical protein